MNIAIIDPSIHCPGITSLFPEADYYGHPANTAFDDCIKDMSIYQNHYGFTYKTDWSLINDKNYDYLIIIAGIHGVPRERPYNNVWQEAVFDVYQKVRDISHNNKFKKVILFDNYDYDYDPFEIINGFKFDICFKRNYNSLKTYHPNTFPFPLIGFGFPCCLWELLNSPLDNPKTENSVFWAGSLFIHDPNGDIYGKYTNRIQYYNEISEHIKHYNGLSYQTYRNVLASHKFAVDLPGVGNPNRRFIEIITMNTLLFIHKDISNITFPFDGFPLKETIYESKEDFIQKVTYLQSNDEYYNECMEKQKHIVKEYLNNEWLRDYIISRMTSL